MEYDGSDRFPDKALIQWKKLLSMRACFGIRVYEETLDWTKKRKHELIKIICNIQKRKAENDQQDNDWKLMGLRNARLNFRQLEETHSMENIIFNELKIRDFNVDVGVIVQNSTDFNGKSIRKQLEIDFVCNKGSKRYYIQSAYAIPDQEKMEQEQRSLMLTGDAFKKIIITKETSAPYYNDDGVLVMSIYDFLLNPKSLEQ